MAEVRILYVATADGVVQLANPGKSDRWREIGRALVGQDVHAVVASPNDPLVAFAASAAGTHCTTNGGASWQLVNATPASSLAFDSTGILHAGTTTGTVLSTADGAAWSIERVSNAALEHIALLADGTLIVVTADGTLYQRTQAGWEEYSHFFPPIRAVAADSAQPTLYVLGETTLYTPQGTQLQVQAPTGALVVLSGVQPVVLFGTASGLLRSDDGGVTAHEVSGPQGVTALVTPPRFIDQAFAGTAGGALWFSSDRGRSWTELRAGYTAIHDLAFARAL